MNYTRWIFLLAFLFVFNAFGQKNEAPANLIPLPQSISWGNGSFTVNAKTVLLYDEKSERAANLLADVLQKATGAALKLEKLQANAAEKAGNSICLISANQQNMAKEEYKLEITSKNVSIQASGAEGYFAAVHTLRQLLPVDGKKVQFPAVKIAEKPAFAWRGMLLDVGRHFFTKEEVKTYLDYLSFYKFNVLHFHLTEDQGWRIEIKKYPKLTEVGAWRIEPDGKKYGGFYTQQDIKDIVAYATSRGISIVPEIEMPGHAVAALASYPELSCTGGPFVPANGWGVFDDVYCAGKENTFTFIQNVLTEIIELFPSEYIHIGGDECPKVRWNACPDCKKRMADEGLKNAHQLQSYFIKRIEKFLNSKGKKINGWDEILEGGIAPSATIQVWRDWRYATEAAQAGHDIIMSPTSHCYFDYAVEGTKLEQVYKFFPIPADLPADLQKHILGGECCLWSERIPDKATLDFRTFPRLLAMSENLWNGKNKETYPNFYQRLQKEYPRLRKMGITSGPEGPAYSMNFHLDGNTYKADVIEIIKGLEFRYTLDGSKPEQTSAKVVNNQISFAEAKSLRIQAFKGGFSYGPELGVKGEFVSHKAKGCPVKFENQPAEKYMGTGNNNLTDGIKGTDNFGDGLWQGLMGKDMVAEVDLGSEQEISYLSLGTLQNGGSWIYFPYLIIYEGSTDGKTYKVLGSSINETSYRKQGTFLAKNEITIDPEKCRYIRVSARNIQVTPEWHTSKFQASWIFFDELIVK
jgi:hexosaminidase